MKNSLLFAFVILLAGCIGNNQPPGNSIDIKVLAVKDTTVNFIRQLAFRCAVKNVSGLNLKAFRGVLKVSDLFNEDLGSFRIMYADGLKKGEVKTLTFRYDLDPSNQGEVQIIGSDTTKLKMAWHPFNIILTNGVDSSIYRD